MKAELNPYAPGAGVRPAALVGRDAQIEAWRVALVRLETGKNAQPVVLYGLRGVGKTVLLSTLASLAEDRKWLVAQVEAGTGKPLRNLIGESLYGPLSDLVRPTAGDKLRKALKTTTSFNASYDTSGTWNFGLDLSQVAGGGANSGAIESDLGKVVQDLSLAAEEKDVGLAFLIDEAQDLTPAELAAISSVNHLAGQREWPFIVALAGLPSIPRMLAEAKSYAERLFVYERIEHLDAELAGLALTEPASAEGASWSTAAVDLVVAESSGYPYFLQQFGRDTWNAAARPAITLDDARIGVATGRLTLDTGFFRARWDRATRAEKRYLRAMAEDAENTSSTGGIASRLDRDLSSLGPVRAKLIDKGLIYAPEHGVVSFTVPGMTEFIQRQST